MPPAPYDALLEQLAVIARVLGAETIALRDGGNGRPMLLRRLLAAGAHRTRHVIGYDGERPFVIETVVLPLCGLVIEMRAPPRPASPGEVAALASCEAFFCIDSCRVVEMTHAD